MMLPGPPSESLATSRRWVDYKELIGAHGLNGTDCLAVFGYAQQAASGQGRCDNPDCICRAAARAQLERLPVGLAPQFCVAPLEPVLVACAALPCPRHCWACDGPPQQRAAAPESAVVASAALPAPVFVGALRHMAVRSRTQV